MKSVPMSSFKTFSLKMVQHVAQTTVQQVFRKRR